MEDYNFKGVACTLPEKKLGIIALVGSRAGSANFVQRGDFRIHQAPRTPRVAPLPLTVAVG